MNDKIVVVEVEKRCCFAFQMRDQPLAFTVLLPVLAVAHAALIPSADGHVSEDALQAQRVPLEGLTIAVDLIQPPLRLVAADGGKKHLNRIPGKTVSVKPPPPCLAS